MNQRTPSPTLPQGGGSKRWRSFRGVEHLRRFLNLLYDGAGYAAGMSGRAMRRHLIRLAHDRAEVLRRVMAARAVAWSEILGAGFGNLFGAKAVL